MPNDLDTPDDEQQPDESAVIRGLRQQAKTAEAAEARAQAAERELTLHKAGLGSLTDKQMKALAAAHDGDWEPESLKATATELFGVQQPEAEPDRTQIPADELASMQRVAAAAGGATASPVDVDAALANATSEAEVTKILAEAGLSGT